MGYVTTTTNTRTNHTPNHLHDLHSDYPLAPERMEVKKDMLSAKQLEILGESKYNSMKKLIPNLFAKLKYPIHYRNLKLYLSLGMELKSVSSSIVDHVFFCFLFFSF